MTKPMIVSFSEISRWDTCKRQYYYNFILGYKPQVMTDPIETGIKGHKLLQDFYILLGEGKSKEEALSTTAQNAKKLFNSLRFADKSLLLAWTLVDNYIRETDFNSEAVLVENRFLFPVSVLDDDPFLSNVQIGFTPDVVFKRKGDFYDVEDSKFIGRAWGQKKTARFVQAKLYQIFLRRMGYNVSRSIVRFFNTTTGKINALPFTLEPGEEETIVNDFVEAIREVVEYRNRSEQQLKNTRRIQNNNACQFCAYTEPCNLESKGKDASKTFKYMFEKSDYDYTK